MSLPTNLLPATWGVSHGSGWAAQPIRNAEREMSKSDRFPQGDEEASWAGHAFVYAGQQFVAGVMQPAIVEAEWPRVKLSPAYAHADAIWAINQPMTEQERGVGLKTVMELVDERYDALAFTYYVGKVFHVALTRDLRPLFADTAKLGPICSGLVVRELIAMHYDLGNLRTAATQDPDFICPADLLRWGLDNNWMNAVPGEVDARAL